MNAIKLAPIALPTSASMPMPAAEQATTPAEPPVFLARLLEGLDDADVFALDARLRRAIRLEQQLDAQIAPLARAVLSPDYELKGERPSKATLARDYLGMSPSKLCPLLRIERVGERCPALRAAYRDGALSWVQADALAPLLDSEAEGDPRRDWCGAWVAFAQSVTGLRLKQTVERARLLHDAAPEVFERHREDPVWFASPPRDDEDEGGASGEAGATDEANANDHQKCAQATHSTERVRLAIHAANDVARLFRAVLCTLRRAIERETGRLPDDAENLTTLCAFHHLRGVHGGTVGGTGSAPDGLEFALGLRAGLAPLARYRSGDRVVVA